MLFKKKKNLFAIIVVRRERQMAMDVGRGRSVQVNENKRER